MTKYRINKTIEQITLIAGNIRTFFAPQGNYVGIDCACDDGSCSGNGCQVIKKAKLLPDEILTLNGSGEITAITNAWGGRFGVNLASPGFMVWLIGLPEEACMELVSYDWTNANSTWINVGESQYSKYLKVPVSVEEAIEVCVESQKKNGDSTNIEFYFDISANYFL